MYIKHKNTELRVDFLHDNRSQDKRGTSCAIFNDKDQMVADGHTIVHNKDNYDKKKGRKLAFGRAIVNAGIPKEERRELWEQYFSKCKK